MWNGPRWCHPSAESSPGTPPAWRLGKVALRALHAASLPRGDPRPTKVRYARCVRLKLLRVRWSTARLSGPSQCTPASAARSRSHAERTTLVPPVSKI